MLKVISCALAIALLLLAPPAIAQEVLAFRLDQQISFKGEKQRLPVDVTIRDLDQTTLHVAATADLRKIQKSLPKLMSRRLKNTCAERIDLKVRDVRAVGNMIRIRGKVHGRFRLCKKVFGKMIKTDLASQSADFDARIAGRLVGNCVEAETRRVKVEASGLLGGFIAAAGLEGLVDELVRLEVDRALGDRDNCFTMPPEFIALETKIEGGAFVDLGGGHLGARVSGTFQTSAPNVVKLVTALDRRGIFQK